MRSRSSEIKAKKALKRALALLNASDKIDKARQVLNEVERCLSEERDPVDWRPIDDYYFALRSALRKDIQEDPVLAFLDRQETGAALK